MKTFKQYQYYILVGIVSLFSVAFLPFLGSEVNLGWTLPTTPSGWVVWAVTKITVAIINILIFYCFSQQGKENSKDNPKYQEAVAILMKAEDKQCMPRSPQQWTAKQYGLKGVTIVITSMLSAIGLTQAILVFDYITLLTYLFTIGMGIVFGVIQMNSAEEYWTEEYWRYANKVKEALNEKSMEMAKEKSTE